MKIIFLLFNLISTFLFAQTNLWSYYWGYGSTKKIQHTSKNIGYYSIYNNDGFSTSDSNRLIKTTDGGTSFMEITIFKNQIKDYYFVSDDIGYLVDNYNFLYKTKDGGITWHDISPKTTAYGQEKLCFFNENIGYSIDSSNNVFKTSDGGLKWTRLTTILGDHIFFLKDNKTGWIGNSTTGKLYKTADAGTTWELLYTKNTLFKAYTDMFFVDSFHGWFLAGDSSISGEYGKLYKTDDGGSSWDLIYNNSTVKFNHLVFKNSSVGVAVGRNGIYKTENSGSTWDYASSYYPDTTSAADVFDDVFYISGINGLHMKTENPIQWDYSMRLGNSSNAFGQYNTRLISAGGYLYGVSNAYDFSSRQTEYYISKIKSDGTQYELKKTSIPVTNSGSVISQLNFQSENSYWFLNSLPFRSVDKGNSWTPLYNSSQPALNYRFIRSKFFDNNNGIALSNNYIGDQYKILKTTNAGTTWDIIKQFEDNTFNSDAHFFDQNNGLVVNSKGEILKTYDGGVTWTVKYVKPSLSGGGFRKLFFVNKSLGFALEYGSVARTKDGGETWSDMSIDALGGCLLEDIYFINDSKGWLSGGCGIYRTSDEGLTWIKETNNQNFEYVYMFNEKSGFATKGHAYYQYHPQPTATNVTNPLNNQTNVSLNTTFKWQAVDNAQAYYVSLGKTNSFETFYKTITSNNYLQPLTLLEPNTTYYLNVIPFTSANQAGNNVTYKFTTGNDLQTSENDLKRTFQVSPNPSRSILHISNNINTDYNIFDLTGKVILQGKIKNNMIDIKNIPPGNYILKIGNSTKKIVKE